MRHPYSRKLDNIDLIDHFLRVVLRYESEESVGLLKKIESGEAELKNYDDSQPTLSSTAHRDRRYLNSSERWQLRHQIVKELSKFKREDDDEDIELGKGGALPNSKLSNRKEAIIIIGLPASGKSSIADKIADEYGAVILDSDFAKRKLPEFKDSPAGASLVHEESDSLIFSCNEKDKPDGFKTLFEICCSNNNNIVIPKIGHSQQSINLLAQHLQNYGYEVHLVLVSLDRRKATIRAINRYFNTGRYVPLSLIFDCYADNPILTYYRLKELQGKKDSYIKSFGKLSTDVEKGEPPILVYADDISPAIIFN